MLLNDAKEVNGKELGRAAAAGLGLFLIALVITMQSPDSIFSTNGVSGTDSSVFRYIGRMMAEGYVPYRDMFDHKGVLIYVINLIGTCFFLGGGGIWLLETVCVFLAVLICYKTARLFCSRGSAILVVLIVFALMYSYYDGGNFTEEWALPFQMAAMYIFLDYFRNQKITKLRLVVCGLSFACVFFLRVNLVSVWFVFCIMVLIRCIRKKDLKSLAGFLLYFILGAGLVTLPVMLYLGCNHALADFIYDYIIFNGMYATNTDYATLADKVNMTVYFCRTLPTIFAFLTMLIVTLINDEKQRRFSIGYLFYMIMTVWLTAMSGKLYNHYGMMLLPMLTYPFCIMFRKFEAEKGRKHILHLVLAGFLMCGIVLYDWHITVSNAINNITGEVWDKELQQVVAYICANTDEDEAISVYGNRDAIYNLTGRKSASRYSYQTPIAQIDPAIREAYYRELQEMCPGLVVLATETEKDEMISFLVENGYELTEKYGSYAIYEYAGCQSESGQ